MNTIFANPDKMREYEETIIRISRVYQQIGMGATVILWAIFWFLYEPEVWYRPFIWILIVGLQFVVIRKLLECRIPIWYEGIPRIQESKEVKRFVFLGATVLLFQNEQVLKFPIYMLVMYLVFIWIGAEIIYGLTEMP